ncbi:ABC transporter ATP-binding protein [Tessaracoccus coleopterorum]|uniref:ABC transporter ATP-binding protein n=1 Tax=Tessaracoccus coleopterorum TaxID=2714950 RepID=UPI002F919243
MPFVIARATDVVVGIVGGHGGEISTLIWLAGALLVLSLANTLLTNLTGYWGDLMATRLRAILSRRYYHKLLRLPQRYYDNELTGTIISRLNRSITSITDFLQMFSNNFFPMLITVFAVLVIALVYSPWLALLLIIIYPAFVWLTALTSKKWQVWEHRKNDHYDIAGGRFAEVVGQMRVVKSFVTERNELARFGGHYDDAVSLTAEQSAFWHKMDTLRRAVLDVVFFVIFAIIFVQTAQGAFTIGVMVMLIQLVNMAKQPVTGMSYLVDTTQRAIAGSEEFFKVMAEIDEPNSPLALDVATEQPTVAWGDDDPVVSFDGVSFGYGDTTDLVLKNIDLAINRGERVAFVGESGGGKTTLVNLLMKLYPATSGTVHVHGQSVHDVPSELLRREIGVVFQDASLFSGTIRENIAYGIDGVTDEQLATAARRANALTFIDRLKDGFDTEIGERGIKLSGGRSRGCPSRGRC